MSKWIGAAALAAAMAFGGAASAADTAYAFNVKNASGGHVAVRVDGKVICMMLAGGSCTVGIDDGDAHEYAYTLDDKTWTTFQPGNLEMVETCKIEAGGAHCTDPTGAATN